MPDDPSCHTKYSDTSQANTVWLSIWNCYVIEKLRNLADVLIDNGLEYPLLNPGKRVATPALGFDRLISGACGDSKKSTLCLNRFPWSQWFKRGIFCNVRVLIQRVARFEIIYLNGTNDRIFVSGNEISGLFWIIRSLTSIVTRPYQARLVPGQKLAPAVISFGHRVYESQLHLNTDRAGAGRLQNCWTESASTCRVHTRQARDACDSWHVPRNRSFNNISSFKRSALLRNIGTHLWVTHYHRSPCDRTKSWPYWVYLRRNIT